MFTVDDFEIIDAHVHPYEDPSDSVRAYGKPETMEEFDREMANLGIDFYAGSPVRKGKADFRTVQELNRSALRLRDRFPRYIPGIHLHGDCPQESCEELHAMVREGVHWIGELVPYFMSTGAPDSPGMLTVFREAEKLGIPVNLHHGEKAEVETIVRECPNLKLVLAHPGESYGEYGGKERMALVAAHKNLYMDISGTGLFRWGFLRWAVDLCGADRLLFGSDMPVCSPGMNLYGTLCEHLTKEEFTLIFSGNFRRLTGMPKS